MQLRSEKTERGVTERSLVFEGESEPVPGLLWTPEGASGPRPLVLLGHGGTQSKRAPNLVSLARRLVRHHAYAALCIDQPHHGERRSEEERGARLSRTEFLRRMLDATPRAVADWRRVLAAVREREDVGDAPLGYWGLSMGTCYGLPLVAGEARIRCAVLGLFGLPDAPRMALHAEAARGVEVPVLFLVQWDDEIAAREEAFALFERLASPEKTLHASPGRHVEVPRREYDASERFLRSHLGEASAAGAERGERPDTAQG